MAIAQKSKKRAAPKRLDSTNAQEVANRGLNPAYTQSQGYKVKDAGGKWVEGGPHTRTAAGLLSINGKNTKGAMTWAMTPKNDDGTPVLGKNGKPRQSGRSKIASRRQREYDIKVGLNKAWQDENGLWHGGTAPAGANIRRVQALTAG